MQEASPASAAFLLFPCSGASPAQRIPERLSPVSIVCAFIVVLFSLYFRWMPSSV